MKLCANWISMIFVVQSWICFICEGCHIEVVECDYDYVYVDSLGEDASNASSATDKELKIYSTDCRVVGSRHRRSAQQSVEEFVSNCISTKMPEKSGFIPLLVQFMMYQTTWYERTEKYYCSSDTVECWRSLCGYFLRWESMYIKPLKFCIENFGKMKGRVFPADQNVKPHVLMPTVVANPFIDENLFISTLRSHLSDDRESEGINWRELIQFYKNEFICSYDFCNCTGLPIANGDGCGDTWITRFVGSVDVKSKYREPLLKAAGVTIQQASRRRSYLIVQLLQKLFDLGIVVDNGTDSYND